ncbi:MAG: UDP-glucose 4-epimerase GalE [Oligoflexia bacterium]|nr:UDP-glucose 4-epimerase GalE [Oligoflexia bacterium]
MKVLVTGGAGYIGSHVCRHLHDAGYEVFVLDNLSTGSKENIISPATFIEGSVGNPELVRQILTDHEIKNVAHFAASIVVPESVENPLKYYENNVCQTVGLLDGCLKSGVTSFLFSSTAAVYGTGNQSEISEQSEIAPMNPYGSTKATVETMLREVGAASGMRHISLRYFNVAGADPQSRQGQRNKKSTHLIKVSCEAALKRRPFVEIFGTDYSTEDGSCVRDFIHVEDLSQAHVQALRYLSKGGPSDIFNVGYGEGYSVKQVIAELKSVSGVDFEVRNAKRRSGDPARLVAKSDKIREKLGWEPKYQSLRKIVTDALNWERQL